MRISSRCISRLAIAIVALTLWSSAAWRVCRAGDEGVAEAVLQAESQRIAAVAKAMPAAVAVFAKGGQGGGSGVVVTPDGYALTNYHVVRPAGVTMQCSMPDGRLYDAVLVGIDAVGDVALIKLLGRDDFPTAEMADSNEVRVGDWCFAIGNPFLLATDFQPTVTYGIVSGVHRYQYPAGTLLEYADCIQTDAAINPGNSGGPLFDAQGRLIGINGRGSFEKRGRVNVGVGYAISINQIKNFMGYLRSGRIVDHATLGATVATAPDGTVRVADILESSDAFRRGLRYDDEVLSLAGREVTTANMFKNILGTLPKGWRVPLTYRRGSEERTIHVRLPGVHTKDELLKKLGAAPPPEEPEKKNPDEKDDKPRRPAPHPKAPPISKHLAQYVKLKQGYANYYFNELNRDRVWSAFRQGKGKLQSTGEWRFAGTQDGNGKCEIVIDEAQVTGTFPQGRFLVDLKQDWNRQLGPAGSGGLLTAVAVWRRFLTVGPKLYGDLEYIGTCPIPGRKGLFDTIHGTYGTVESRFYFEPDTGRLVLLEMFPDRNVDPCEVYFDDYRDVGGELLPHRWEVHFGDGQFGILQWEQVALDAKTSAGNDNQPKKNKKAE